MAGGLGMGVGKETDWVRKDKVVPCKLLKIVIVLTKKKDRISAEKLLNNINNCRNGVQTKVEKQAWSMDGTWKGNQFGNQFEVCWIYSESENGGVLIIRST